MRKCREGIYRIQTSEIIGWDIEFNFSTFLFNVQVGLYLKSNLKFKNLYGSDRTLCDG